MVGRGTLLQNVRNEWQKQKKMGNVIALTMVLVSSLVVAFAFHEAAFAAPLDKVTQVSTGSETACAVTDGKVACWGRGDGGQLGNGSSGDASKPVFVVAKEAYTETVPARKECSFVIFCNTIPEKTVDHERTPLGGKYVTKVSVGKNHACAIASARVYCWGNNSSGQLGTRSTNGSNTPVAVDISGVTPAKPGYCNGTSNGLTGCAWPTGVWVNEVPALPASSLFRKEVIDISAGDQFTCALASDGVVSCWGEGDNGRLGTDNTTDVHYPTSVAGAALNGKSGVRLAKASNQTMCVIAVNKGQANTGSGAPYCWGKGIDGGQTIPANGSTAVACSKSSPTTPPAAKTTTTIFESKRPTAIPGATVSAIDGQDYLTGLGTDSKAYYWGMYGYQEVATYSDVRSCKVNPCTGAVVMRQEPSAIVLAGQVGKKTQVNGKTTSQSGRQNAVRKTTTTTRTVDRTTGKVTTTTTTTYYKANKNKSNNCTPVTHYAYTKKVDNTPVGKKVATVPPTWPQAQSGIKTLSGGVFSDSEVKNLFCAQFGSGIQCDGHGAKTTSGQLGNGSTAQVSGPQAVTMNGWFAGKQITSLGAGSTNNNTSTSYSCALASGTVGCWGVNSRGQLGVGDKNSRSVATGVQL